MILFPGRNSSVHYPDTLVNMWNYSRDIPTDNFTERDCERAYNSLCQMLASYFLKHELPGITTKDAAMDEASDFLVALLQGACPSHIQSSAYFIANARKYLARKNNPVQYEMNDILHIALLELEKEHKVERDSNSLGHRISDKTLFALTGTPVSQTGSTACYEQHRSEIPNYASHFRSNSPEHARMLPPADAKQLVLHLLNAFGGWTHKADLLRTMKNHIPEQMTIVTIESPTDDNADNNPVENIAGDDDDFIYEVWLEQGRIIINETATRIWERICKISNKVFCLYSLPKLEGVDGVDMKSVGNSSTVSDQNKKIITIIQDELKEYRDYNQVSKRESIAIQTIVRKILDCLHGNCTDSGYISVLSKAEANA